MADILTLVDAVPAAKNFMFVVPAPGVSPTCSANVIRLRSRSVIVESITWLLITPKTVAGKADMAVMIDVVSFRILETDTLILDVSTNNVDRLNLIAVESTLSELVSAKMAEVSLRILDTDTFKLDVSANRVERESFMAVESTFKAEVSCNIAVVSARIELTLTLIEDVSASIADVSFNIELKLASTDVLFGKRFLIEKLKRAAFTT